MIDRFTRQPSAFPFHVVWAFALAALPTASGAAGLSLREPSRGQKPAAPADNQGDAQARDDAPPEVPLGRRSPRATMGTFLNALEEAERGQIERYADALACLDLSGVSDLAPEGQALKGRKLASLLSGFIDKHGLELELIPDEPGGESYTYYKTSDGRPAIQIRRRDDGVWLFTWGSLTFVENPPQEPATDEGRPAVEARPPAARAQVPPREAAAAEKVPSEFLSARATMRTFREAMQEGRTGDAAKCLDLSDFPLVIHSEKGTELAVYLREAIKRTKPVVLIEFSDDPNSPPHIFRTDALGDIVIARQGDADSKPGHWLFTRKTVAGIESLYERLVESGVEASDRGEADATPFTPSLWLRSHVPESLKGTWLLLKHWQWLALVVLFALGMIAQRLTTFLLRSVTGLWLRRRGLVLDEGVRTNSFRPLGILAAAAVWWVGLTWFALRADVLTVLLGAVKFIACWATVWTVYRAVDLLADCLASLAAKTETKVDDLLVPLARKVAKVAVTVVGLVFIVEQFTESKPVELLAGLGLGGLALAFAAQDTLKNLFGSLTVIADRPFEVGDWVQIGDIEGTVESVGFRSTRVRTFYNSQMVVPNATLMSTAIDNYGARHYRRIRVMLSLTYSTPPEKIDAFCEGIRELIRLHSYTRKDYYHVYFNKFAASSLDVLLYCFLEVPDWGTELRERHHLFCDILRLAKKLGVEFAFPTQTLWVERSRAGADVPKGVSIIPGLGDADVVGLDQAAKVFEEAYGPAPTHRKPVVIERSPRSKRSAQTGTSRDGDGP